MTSLPCVRTHDVTSGPTFPALSRHFRSHMGGKVTTVENLVLLTIYNNEFP
jgi:hypothetical protein